MALFDEEKRNIIRAFYIPLFLLYLIWVIKIIEFLGGISFSDYGIYPRRIEGLIGIICAPLLHASFGHLINNSAPLVILTASILYFYRSVALKVIILIWVITGLCVWIGARSAYHIGASGIIYGDAAFIFFSGAIRKNIKLLAISLMTVFLYGGMIWGIFPIDMKISWESHLFGGLTGMILAFIYAGKEPVTEEKVWEEDPDEYPYWEETEEEDHENKNLPI